MRFRDEIRETVSPHKFGGDKMAAALWLLSLDGGQDEQTGDVEWSIWAARFGRRILYCDTYGFVGQTRYATEALAIEQFRLIDDDYSAWRSDE